MKIGIRGSLIAITVVACMVHGLAFAGTETSGSVEFKSHIGGFAWHGLIEGNYLYAVMGRTLYIADVTDKTDPQQVGFVYLPSIARRIAIQGTIAYIACTTSGLISVDISVPGSPQIMGSLDFSTPETSCQTFDVDIQGNYAFVADHTGFHVVDITNPDNLVTKVSITEFEYATPLPYNVYVHDTYVYLNTQADGLYIFDITDPVSPVLTSHFEDTNAGSMSYDTIREGNYLYLAAGANGLVIADVSDPADPVFVSNIEQDYEGVIALVKKDNYVYLCTEFGDMRAIDVSDVTNLRETGVFAYEGHQGRGITLFEDYVVLATNTHGIRLVSVSGSTMNQVGSFTTIGRIEDCQSSGGYAYVATGINGLQVLDIQAPSNPVPIATVDTYGPANGVFIKNGTLYLTEFKNEQGEPGGYLEIFSLSSPASPSFVGRLTLDEGEPYDVTVSGNTAYIAVQTKGLTLVDISDPAVPTQISRYDTPGIYYQSAPWGNYLLGADGLQGMVVLDTNNTASIHKLGSYQTVGEEHDVGDVHDVAMWDSCAYLAGGADGLSIIDMSLPYAPALVESLQGSASPEQTGEIEALTALNSYLLVAEFPGRVRLFDIADPAQPVTLAEDSDLAGNPTKISWDPERQVACVVSPIAGLHIFEVTTAAEPSINIDGLWVGSGTAAGAGNEIGLSASIDQAHGNIIGTVTVFGDSTQQGVLSATITGESSITGTVNLENESPFAVDMQLDEGLLVLSGTFADGAEIYDVRLSYGGSRGHLDLKGVEQMLYAALAEKAAETDDLMELFFLNTVMSLCESSLNQQQMDSALAYLSVMDSLLSLYPQGETIQAASYHLAPSADWETRNTQAIARNYSDDICAEYEPWLSSFVTIGNNFLEQAAAQELGGNSPGAFWLYGGAVTNYTTVFDLYRQFKPNCPGFGIGEFSGYFEGDILFSGIIPADMKVCAQQDAEGAVTGEVYIFAEAMGVVTGTILNTTNQEVDGKSVVSGVMEMTFGETKTDINILGWYYNLATGNWEGEIEVASQEMIGNVTLKFVSDECPPGWNE